MLSLDLMTSHLVQAIMNHSGIPASVLQFIQKTYKQIIWANCNILPTVAIQFHTNLLSLIIPPYGSNISID